MLYKLTKRAFDLALSTIALVILAPLIAITGCCVYIFIGSPVIYRQQRPGYKGQVFSIYKFRSMNNNTDAKGNLLPDGKRLGRFGQLLRASSLDELPALWNVCKGDMSLVGPRPLLEEYIPLYTDKQATRHDVKPGITGWAQVNGRNSISWEEKFFLDIWYIENCSFWLDLKILVMTFFKVVKRSDINADGEATMGKFKGNGGSGKC